MSKKNYSWKYQEPVVFLLLMLFQLTFLSQLMSTEIHLILGLLLFLLALSISVTILAAHHFRLFNLHMLMLMMVLGMLGMLLGTIMDFGLFGLLSLLSLCTSQSNFGLVEILTKVSIAPWTYGGMILGCNLGMLISRLSFCYRLLKGTRDLVIYIICNAGMITGMLLAESVMPLIGSASVAAMATMMILLMLAGMAIGMMISRWLAGFVWPHQPKYQVLIGRGV